MKEYKIPFIRYNDETDKQFQKRWSAYIEQFKDVGWFKELTPIPVQLRVDCSKAEGKEL